MSEIVTTKALDLSVLAEALGGVPVVSRGGEPWLETEKTVSAEGVDETALSAAIDAHLGPRRVKLSPREFVSRIAGDEIDEVELSEDPDVRQIRREMFLAIEPDLEDPELIGMLQVLTMKMRQDGITPILAAHRPAEILNPYL